jgi:hypothetical protein
MTRALRTRPALARARAPRTPSMVLDAVGALELRRSRAPSVPPSEARSWSAAEQARPSRTPVSPRSVVARLPCSATKSGLRSSRRDRGRPSARSAWESIRDRRGRPIWLQGQTLDRRGRGRGTSRSPMAVSPRVTRPRLVLSRRASSSARRASREEAPGSTANPTERLGAARKQMGASFPRPRATTLQTLPRATTLQTLASATPRRTAPAIPLQTRARATQRQRGSAAPRCSLRLEAPVQTGRRGRSCSSQLARRASRSWRVTEARPARRGFRRSLRRATPLRQRARVTQLPPTAQAASRCSRAKAALLHRRATGDRRSSLRAWAGPSSRFRPATRRSTIRTSGTGRASPPWGSFARRCRSSPDN